MCLQLSPPRPFSRSLRYCFGQLCYDAVAWYVSQLRFPDVPLDSTRGITWLELVLDFELATAVRLPGAEKIVLLRTVHVGAVAQPMVLCTCLLPRPLLRCNMISCAFRVQRGLAIAANFACGRVLGTLDPSSFGSLAPANRRLARKLCDGIVLMLKEHACSIALLRKIPLLLLVKEVSLLRMLFALQSVKTVLTLIISLSPPFLPVGP